MEIGREKLDSLEFVFPTTLLKIKEDQCLEKFHQLKDFDNARGHARVGPSNTDNLLVGLVNQQRCCWKWKIEETH